MLHLRKKLTLPSILALYALLAINGLIEGFSTSHIRHFQHIHAGQYHTEQKYQSLIELTAQLDQDNNEVASEDSFDGKGFASYLAPYVFSLIASIVVTGAFVKFVLLDY
jgi:hypothetical protein